MNSNQAFTVICFSQLKHPWLEPSRVGTNHLLTQLCIVDASKDLGAVSYDACWNG